MISLQYTKDGMLRYIDNPDQALVQAHIESLLNDTAQSILFYTPLGLLIVSSEPNRQIDLKLKDEGPYSDATRYAKLPPVERPTRQAVISSAEAIRVINHLIATGEFPADWTWAV